MHTRVILILTIALLTCAGCTSDSAALQTPASPAATAAILTLAPSATPQPAATATITPRPTLTPLPSVTPLPSMTSEPTMHPTTRYVTTEMVNARQCIGVDCEVVTQLSYGDSFRALGQGTDADGAIWYRFKIGTEDLWIAGWFTSTERPAAQTTISPLLQSTQPPAPNWNCSGNRYDCADFASCAEMWSYWNACPGDPSNLDGEDNDGRPCELRCG